MNKKREEREDIPFRIIFHKVASILLQQYQKIDLQDIISFTFDGLKQVIKDSHLSAELGDCLVDVTGLLYDLYHKIKGTEMQVN